MVQGDFTTRTPEEMHAIAVSGGSVKSPAKTAAAKLRGIWRTKNPNERQQKLMSLISDPNLFDLELLQLYQDILESEELNDRSKIELLKTMVGVKGAVHGVKSKNLNVNLDYNQYLEQEKERWTNWTKEYSEQQKKKKTSSDIVQE